MARPWLVGWAMLGMLVSSCGGGGDAVPAAADEGGFTPLAAGEGVTVGATGGDVASDDGRFVLSFPAGAVAEDTVVAVDLLASEEWPDVLDGVDPTSVVYRLEPSGLTFAQPVGFTLTSDLATTDDGLAFVPLAVLITDDATAQPVGFDVEIDRAAGVTVLSGTIEHFSMVVEHNAAFAVGLEQISPEERKLGRPWEADVEIRSTSSRLTNGGEDLELDISYVGFKNGDFVAVKGSQSHPGFVLPGGASRKLDFPVPRWECWGVEDGTHYGVEVGADLSGSLNSEFTAAILSWVYGAQTTWYIYTEADVSCELPQFTASGGGENLSVSGQVDITKAFKLSGAVKGGSITMSFSGGNVTVSSDGDRVLHASGTFTYSGGGSGARMSGSGTYTIDGQVGKPLTLHHDAGGCTNPGECKDTEGPITLTPVE